MPLRVFNTLTQRQERFRTREPGIVKMFVCGPTVYDFIHLGHARTYLAFDIIARYLRWSGYQVQFVVNITDVDEHVFERAEAEHTAFETIAARYTRHFFDDLSALGIQSITRFPRASEFVAQASDHVVALIRKGFAYAVDGHVFFDVAHFPAYGRLSGQTAEDLELHRLDPHPAKRHQTDFGLWRQSERAPRWSSPLSKGRPGWHIEDTAMALGCLGGPYDIHGGGRDLLFPHHEAQIAQGEALSGAHPFVRYWLHTGPLNVGAHKMSKSLGNFIRVRDALSRYPADLLRIFVAGHQYRAPVVVDEERFRLARRQLAVFREALNALRDNQANRSPSPRIEVRPRRRITESETAFRQAMNDDFDTPRALAIGLDLARLIVQKRRTGDNLHQLAGHGLTAMLDVFGVLQERRLAQSPITGGA